MTELMKQYEKKVGQPVNWIKNPKGYTDYVTSLLEMSEIHNAVLKDENERLRDQLRWRPVSEKPEKDDQYLCRWEGDGRVVMRYKNGTWFIWDDIAEEYFKAVYPPYEWLPIPPAPEGE